MSDEKKILIKIYKTQNSDELTTDFVSDNSKLEVGSFAASTAAYAASLLQRAANACEEGERADYIKRNTEIIRSYMIHLIDEDVKCRGPILKAYKDGDPNKIEACIQPATAIAAEIINMLNQLLGLGTEIADICQKEFIHYVKESAELSMGAIRARMSYILNFADLSTDDTYKYVLKRENEITLGQCEESWKKISGH